MFNSLFPKYKGDASLTTKCWACFSGKSLDWRARWPSSSWSQVPSPAVQATAYSFPWEDLWNDKRQFEEGDISFAWPLHPGINYCRYTICYLRSRHHGLFFLLDFLFFQAPRTSRASLIKGSRSQANALAQQTLIAHWQSIVKILTNYLNVLKANYVCYLKICINMIHIPFFLKEEFALIWLSLILTGPVILNQQSVHSNLLIY